ncbi:MAG: carboxypeptidase regulatory-like domain-containing protein, partial [Candidatus Acidiferrales bacterium]
MKTRMAALILAVIAVSALAASAQTFRGSVSGTVKDATGAVVPGARVAVKNVDTGIEREAQTDETGYYVVTELPIGNYSVTVEKDGFQRAVVSSIRVDVAADRRVDLALSPGALTQTTEVVGTVPLVDTTTNVLGGTIVAKQATELPISGRDFTKLLVLVPGATGSPDGITDFPGSFGLFSSNGSRGRSNNFLLDGTDMNDGYRNLPAINEAGVFGTPATILPLDAIAETRVLSNFEPEYGRNGGAVVNIVTKSGTNDLHGSVYWYFRNDHLNARNFFNNVGAKDKFRYNDFGASVGGPIRKNQTFFFVAYEGVRESGAITTLVAVPTLDDYFNAVGLIGGNQAACTTNIPNCIQGNLAFFNPVIENFFSLCAGTGRCSGGALPWPLPTPGREGLTSNAIVPAPFRNRVDSVIAKVDHNFNPNNLLTVRYFFGDSDQSFPLGLAGGNNLPNTNTFTPTTVNLVSLSYVRVFSPTRVNEFRFGYNRFDEDFLADDRDVFRNPLDTLQLNTGVTNERDFGLPVLRVGSFAFLGSSGFSNPRGRVDTNWQAIDNYSWKSGRHDFKFGVEFRRTFVNSFNDSHYRGRLRFNGDATGDALADFLSGDAEGFSFIYAGDSHRGTFQNSWAGYIQDSWRVTPRFTFNWGLRYDYYGVLDEERNRISRYDPAVGLLQLGSPGFKRLYDRDWNNFGPRLSFAWDPWGDGKTVIRAGWGLFYDAYSQDFFLAHIPFNSFAVSSAQNPIGGSPVLFCFTLNPALGTPNTLEPNTPIYDPACFQPGAFDTTDITQANPNLRTPYIQNYNFNIQRELWTNTVLQVSYVGSKGTKLFRTREINMITDLNVGARPFDTTAPLCPVTTATCPVDNTVQPFIVNELESTATSNYNSLQVSFTQRNWHGWTNNLNWTWSHSIDTASDGNESTVPNAGTPDNSHDPHRERGNSNFDTRHRFVWSFIYDIPQLHDSHPRLTSGWQLSGIVS